MHKLDAMLNATANKKHKDVIQRNLFSKPKPKPIEFILRKAIPDYYIEKDLFRDKQQEKYRNKFYNKSFNKFHKHGYRKKN